VREDGEARTIALHAVYGWWIEHFFQRIKRFRRIAMRFEKLAKNFLAFVQLAAVLVWLL
jgi:transposase